MAAGGIPEDYSGISPFDDVRLYAFLFQVHKRQMDAIAPGGELCAKPVLKDGILHIDHRFGEQAAGLFLQQFVLLLVNFVQPKGLEGQQQQDAGEHERKGNGLLHFLHSAKLSLLPIPRRIH